MTIGPTGSGYNGMLIRSDLQTHVRMRIREQVWLADRILPRIEVNRTSDEFLKVPAEAVQQKPVSLERAMDGSYRQIVGRLASDNYVTVEKGVEVRVDQRRKSQYDDQIDLDTEAAEMSTDTVLLDHEITVRDLVHDTGVWTGTANALGVTNKWNNSASKIVSDINFAAEEVRKKCGAVKGQLHLALGYRVANDIMVNDDFRAAMKIDSQPLGAIISEQLIAAYFGLGGVHVGRQAVNTANSGLTAQMTEVWDNDKAFLFLPHQGTTTRGGAGLGRTFTYVDDGGQFVVEDYFNPVIRSRVIRARHDVHAKLFGTEFGFLFTGVIS